MYILKNAIVSITRNKGRNLLIAIIIIVISCAISVTLAIRNSANSLISSYENKYDVTASIGINRESMRGEMKREDDIDDEKRSEQKENMMDIFSNASNISVEDIDNYGDSEYVKDYYYQISVGVNSDEIEAASMTVNNDNGSEGDSGMAGGMGKGKQDFTNLSNSNSDFTLVGYYSLIGMEEFISGTYSITDGSVFSDLESNSCVINSELATLNNIEVGDSIKVVDPDNSNNVVTLTVTGIFDENSSTDGMMGMFTSSANTIITNTSVINTLLSNNTDMSKTITPTFVLTGRDVVDKFSNELVDKGLNEYLTVTTNLDQVDSATSTISNVKTFATTFLIITLIIGGVVLFVINMINVRERKYEIGVLRTIGLKKSLLSLQFICELLIVAIISLGLGAGIGACVSVPVSNSLLQSEISSSNQEMQNISDNFGMKDKFDKVSGVVSVLVFDKIDAVVDIKVLGQLFVIGILLTLVSSIASVSSIQRFSPLTILKERS